MVDSARRRITDVDAISVEKAQSMETMQTENIYSCSGMQSTYMPTLRGKKRDISSAYLPTVPGFFTPLLS